MSSAEDEDLPVAGTAVILRDGARGIEVLLMRRPDRGSFARAWVFPGGMLEPGDRVAGAEESEDAGRAALRETAEEVRLALERLVLLSCWVPPEGIPKRVRTWFFLAEDPGTGAVAAEDEAVDVRWFAPDAALAANDAGEISLMPPTWRTLHGLLGAATVQEAFALARVPDPAVFRTRMEPSENGRIFYWDGDELAGGAPGARHRLVAEKPVWRYERV
ncbi:NUDIX domain-containing protein [Microbacterium azadirachtae]|uniref:NUDIX domain protein n=1 Tax=Microbacterium azadirachtae TaxID=582680 RepID=A0A0F0LCN6_9MICO|nr:NUDIX hydrolase [Microbacterium azadirachtae]KJL30977.1 NUDIX domain protein [Microbacterium azadirachtae]